MIERLSPSLSAFWASAAMIFIVVTQHPLKALLRGERNADKIRAALKAGGCDFISGMISGAAQHDRHRRGHRGGGNHHRLRFAHRRASGCGGVCGAPLRRQRDADADICRHYVAAAGNGAAHHRKLHCRLVPDGPGGGGCGRAKRADCAAGGGASFRLLLRNSGGRHPAGGVGGVRRGGHLRRRPHPHGGAGVYV